MTLAPNEKIALRAILVLFAIGIRTTQDHAHFVASYRGNQNRQGIALLPNLPKQSGV
jgi:hypothetical protein